MTADTSRPTPLRSMLSALVMGGLLALLVSTSALPSHAASAPDIETSHTDTSPLDTLDIATLDWTLAETLLALGVSPVGVAQIDTYREWVGEPAVPPGVADLGLRARPNPELLARLAPDRILISPRLASLESRLSRIAPVTTLSLYAAQEETWQSLRRVTRQVASIAGREQAGERLIADTEAYLAQQRRALPEPTPPLLLVQFMDARHVRVFGAGGLYQAVLERLGLDNAWSGPTNAWGFSLVGLEQLIDVDGRIVVIEPLPTGVAAALADNALWHHLRDSRQAPVIHLPPVWSFGALVSAGRFAELLSNALLAPPGSSGDAHEDNIRDDR